MKLSYRNIWGFHFLFVYLHQRKIKIKHILSRVNVKYLRGLLHTFNVADWDYFELGLKPDGICKYLRYNGYQFLVNEKTIIKELYRRGL